MRFVQIDETGKIIGYGNAESEHFDHAAERGETLVEIPDDAPHQFDGVRVDLVTRQLVKADQ